MLRNEMQNEDVIQELLEGNVYKDLSLKQSRLIHEPIVKKR